MANEPPAPKTHFAITPARAKGTLADYDAGNLAPPKQPTEAEMKTRRRKPNPVKSAVSTVGVPSADVEELRRQARVAEEIEAPPDGVPLAPHARVLADLLFKRKKIDMAIAALRELYE